MTQEVREYVKEKTQELIGAATCSREAREAAQAWLDAAGTDREAEETKKYIAELEEDIVTVDGLAAFARSEAGAKVFGGAEAAAGVAKHAEEKLVALVACQDMGMVLLARNHGKAAAMVEVRVRDGDEIKGVGDYFRQVRKCGMPHVFGVQAAVHKRFERAKLYKVAAGTHVNLSVKVSINHPASPAHELYGHG